jgi:hypothetical protein
VDYEGNHGLFTRELAQEFAGFVTESEENRDRDIKINLYELNLEPGLVHKMSWLKTSGHKIEQTTLGPSITSVVDFTDFSLNIFTGEGWNLDEALLLLIGSLGSMVRFALSRRSKVAAFHAASLAWGDQGLLLVGDTGAGKTSLSYLCVKQGFKYLTDEDSFIEEREERQWQILGYQRRIRLSGETLAYYPGLLQRQDECRPSNIFNQPGHIVDLNRISPGSYIASAPLRVVVVLRNDKNHTVPQITRLDKSGARLWLLHSLEAVAGVDSLRDEGNRLNRQGFYLVDNLLDFIKVFELKYNISEHIWMIPQQLRRILSLA